MILDFESKKSNCFFNRNDGGYESHSYCALRGYFHCHDCDRFIHVKDKFRVDRWRIWEAINYIEESNNEIENEMKKIRNWIEFIKHKLIEEIKNDTEVPILREETD